MRYNGTQSTEDILFNSLTDVNHQDLINVDPSDDESIYKVASHLVEPFSCLYRNGISDPEIQEKLDNQQEFYHNHTEDHGFMQGLNNLEDGLGEEYNKWVIVAKYVEENGY